MENIVYSFENSVYLNLTNKCCCACTFCIRNQMDGLGSADSLWLEKEPTQQEINEAIDNFDWQGQKEVVFCGYGEPTCALDKLLETAKYIRSKMDVKLRLNTNGLSDLINKKETAKLLSEAVDEISISLNAPDEEAYLAVTRPVFGKGSFEAMLKFASECKEYAKSVKLTVVDTIPEEQIEASKALADSLGIPLRVREFSD
ncbi:MAG: TIGR04100 family radical SAM protein [Acutalibacteraceae bacterium]